MNKNATFTMIRIEMLIPKDMNYEVDHQTFQPQQTNFYITFESNGLLYNIKVYEDRLKGKWIEDADYLYIEGGFHRIEENTIYIGASRIIGL